MLQLETDRYSIDLQLPEHENPIARSDVQGFLQERVDELLDGVSEEPEPGYFETHQYELASNWGTAESTYLYAILVRGHSYTGGAHSMSFVQTFAYSKSNNGRILLEDLLNGEDSLHRSILNSSPTTMRSEGRDNHWEFCRP